MLLLRSLLFDACLYLWMLVLGIVCLPAAAWSRDGANAAVKLYSRTVLWLLAAICGLRVEVRGRAPEGDVIVCAKHQSFLDILVLVRELPRPKFIMKRELRWAPILGLYAMRIGSTPVARGQRSRAMAAMVDHVSHGAAEPSQLVIYPQGTRVAPGAHRPYKIGSGVLYERLGKTCVPVATNAGVFWGRRSFYRRPGLAVVEFLEPIPPGLPLGTFMARIEQEVEDRSNRLMQEVGSGAAGEPASG
jgi:1-acyl-sn-glycerol-3-phosphate acyltransferase